MSSGLRQHWDEFRSAAPGTRFRARFKRRARERARGGSQISRILILLGALFSIAIAIPLMILPGPAVVFWFIAGFLLAGESGWIAAGLDAAERFFRRLFKRFRRSRQQA